jgi:hypothetical protein
MPTFRVEIAELFSEKLLRIDALLARWTAIQPLADPPPLKT